MSDIQNYILELTVLGPVHIGSGTQISKKDCLYLQNEKKVYVMSPMKVFEGMKRNNLLKDYETFLMDDRQKNFTFFIRDHRLSPAEYKSWAEYTLPLNDVTDTLNNSRKKGGGSDNIAAFIKDPYGCPYIPGSSLKGALRTIIQNTLIMKNRDKFKAETAQINTEQFIKRKDYLAKTDKKISEKLFFTLHSEQVRNGELKKGDGVNDIFQGLRVSDSRPLSVDDLILCQKIDMLPDGVQKSLPIKRECLRVGTKVVFELEIDRDIIKLSKDSILRAADSFYDNYRRCFLSAFPKADAAEKRDRHLIYIGGGAGFATKTSVYPLFEDKASGVNAVQRIMVNTTSVRGRDLHKHGDDVRKYYISPHMRKCTKYRRQVYDMGLCSIDIKIKK